MTTSEVRNGTDQGGTTGDNPSERVPQSSFNDSDDHMARKRRAGLYCQITEGKVSFDHIAKAWWIRANPANSVEEKEKRVSLFLEYKARKKFGEEHKGILKDYLNKKPWAGCALTGDGWVHSVMNITNQELVSCESRVHQLCRDAHRTFDVTKRGTKAKKDLTDIGEMLYSVLARVIYTASILEDQAEPKQRKKEALEATRKEWETVRTTVEGMIQRQARFEYFEGVGLGAVITIPALAFAGLAAARYGSGHFDDPGAVTAAIIGGAVGAVISVTQRMTANTLVLDFTAPKHQKLLLGALRPIVGAILAAVVCFAIIGGLLAVEARTGKDASVALAFFAVTGFAAGFSERFATDVLDRASRGILPTARGPQGVESPRELEPQPKGHATQRPASQATETAHEPSAIAQR